MQLRLLAGAALAGLLSVPMVRSAEPGSPPSNIVHVTLYGGRADVCREAKSVPLAAGENRILFELPPTLIEESVRASGYGAPGTRVVNIEVPKPGPRSETSSRNPRVEALEVEIAALDARLAGLKAGDEFLKAILPDEAARGAPSKAGAVLRERHQFLVDAVAASREEADRIRRAQDGKRAERKRVQLELRRSSADLEPRRVVVEIRSDDAVTIDLTLDYSVKGASWRPEYDVDVAEDFSSVQIGYFGVLTQSTGEDWSGVAVTLSTARPTAVVRRELEPWRLFVPPPKPEPSVLVRGGRAELPKGELSSIRVIDTKEQGKIRAINTTEEVGTVVGRGGSWSASFDVAEPIDLPSDGSSRRMRIAVIPLEAEVRHEAVPVFGNQAYLVAETTNTSDRPFLRGKTRVTLGGAFLGSGRMNEAAPAQEFTIALGVDPYVEVQRKVVERSETVRDERGRRKSRYAIEVVNRRTRGIEVTLRERIPVSADRDVDVRGLKIEPKVDPDDDGIVEWKFSVEPAGTARATVGYEVRFPAGRRPGNL